MQRLHMTGGIMWLLFKAMEQSEQYQLIGNRNQRALGTCLLWLDGMSNKGGGRFDIWDKTKVVFNQMVTTTDND